MPTGMPAEGSHHHSYHKCSNHCHIVPVSFLSPVGTPILWPGHLCIISVHCLPGPVWIPCLVLIASPLYFSQWTCFSLLPSDLFEKTAGWTKATQWSWQVCPEWKTKIPRLSCSNVQFSQAMLSLAPASHTPFSLYWPDFTFHWEHRRRGGTPQLVMFWSTHLVAFSIMLCFFSPRGD